MRALVVSDIHAMSRDLAAAGGYVGRTGGKLIIEDRSFSNNALVSIPRALQDYEGTIDVLFCLGDLAHQAKKTVLMCVWNDLHHIAAKLRIPSVIAVTGNHDVASRPEDFKDAAPSQFLKEIFPCFPSDQLDLSRAYDSQSYAFKEVGKAGVLLIDTCSLHGYGGGNADKIYNKGFISRDVVDSAVDTIKKSSSEYYIVVMHHHPRRVDLIVDSTYDEAENGEYLLSALEQSGKPGILIHGHKHFVSLKRAGNKPQSPWVFSASSLAANAYENMERFFSNQFHLVDFESVAKGGYLRGRIRSWEWGTNKWDFSENEMMKHSVGFGSSLSTDTLASEVAKIVQKGHYDIEELKSNLPDLGYLTPDEIKDLVEKLKALSITTYKGDTDQVAAFFRSADS
ncbi:MULTISPECIES: metallophosphoesterase [unclassified Mesorhizobium]|uniref:metallophosphoesterase family protein n=1 Tax=unclassified Mesorhizobium TaxID=325217 RepID=UPI0011297976|nr:MULTISPECIES: metallophosphoesterase [unclassified Mesorhizobium]TPN47744.1 hypothetical protein FJ978_22865 [Mesorhizobium sp. B1-1-7]TPN58393.1 hypothetical protein FJ976_00270 [Mesorhizobium sp. B1-1-9]